MGRIPPSDRKTPGELYAGMSFTAVTEMAQSIGHDNVFIVTGGIGLGRHTDKIAPYDFTSDKKQQHNAPSHVRGEKFLPHLWWGKINEGLTGNPTPIASLLKTHDYIVGALPKIFIKYISADLEACGEDARQNRIFIPIPRSMLGSVPMALRSAFVPYGPEYLSDVMYTRVDKPQRVLQKFLKQCADSDIVSHAAAVAGMVSDTPAREEVDFDKMFKEHPEILAAADVGTALHRVKLLGLKPGGKSRFAGAWRSAQGLQEVEVSKEERELSTSALKDILAAAGPVVVSSEEVILERIGIFLVALREVDKTIPFTAKEVVGWGKSMYAENDLQGLDNTNKVAYTLLYNAGYLGLEILEAGGKKAFRLL